MFEKQQINAVVFVNRIYLNHSQTILLQIYERRISLRGGCSFCFILKLSAGEFLFCNEYFISMLNYTEDATLLCSFAQTCLFDSQLSEINVWFVQVEIRCNFHSANKICIRIVGVSFAYFIFGFVKWGALKKIIQITLLHVTNEVIMVCRYFVLDIQQKLKHVFHGIILKQWSVCNTAEPRLLMVRSQNLGRLLQKYCKDNVVNSAVLKVFSCC